MNKAKSFTKLISTYTLTLILPIVLVGGIALVILLGIVSQRAGELNHKIVNQIVNSIDTETSYILKNSSWIIDSETTDEFISQKYENKEDLKFYAWKNIAQFQTHTNSDFVENIAIYSTKNNVVVNDASMYTPGEYYEKYIRPAGISPESFEKAISSRSTSFFYLIPEENNIDKKFVFCRTVTRKGMSDGVLMIIINGELLIDAVIDSEKKSDYPFSVFDKHGNCFISSGNMDSDAVNYAMEKKNSGIYQYENNTLIIYNSKQSGFMYIFYITANVYTGGSSGLAVIFLELLIIIILISSFIAKRKNDKIKNRFMDYRKENTLLSEQLAGYMKDVRKNNMIKVLQNYINALGKPANYDFRFKYTVSRVMIMYIISPEDYVFSDFESNTERLSKFNSDLSEKLAKNSAMCDCAREEENLYVYVINHPENADFGNISDIFSSLVNQYSIEAFTGIGNPVTDINKISQSYEDALSAMNYAKTTNAATPVVFDSIETEGEITKYSPEKEEKLIRAINHGTEDVIITLFNEIYNDNYHNTALPQRLIFDVISTLYRAIEETSQNKEDKLQKYDRICKQIMKMNTPEAFEVLKEVALDLAKNNKDADKQSLIREKILSYTEEMYLNQDFCLQMLADEMNMNYYNVSRLFTEYIGESFISYVTSKRLEKAREYLSQTDMSVEDIAFKVGFIRSSSFINVFKKYYGLTPGKYRQSIK